MQRHFSHPKLRSPSELTQKMHEGREVAVLSCPVGISQRSLIMPVSFIRLLKRMDGSNTLASYRKECEAVGITMREFEHFLKMADEALYLDSPSFDEARNEKRKEYRQEPTRAAAFVKKVYPSSPRQLTEMLKHWVTEARSFEPSEEDREDHLAVLHSPHIDYHRGGVCYGEAYKRMAGRKYDCLLLIGTGHQPSRRIFHCTTAHHETPLGKLTCDVRFMQRMGDRYGRGRAFEDEYLHAKEHSLELQIPFMQHVGVSATIAPLLVGSFHKFIEEGNPPETYEEYESFVSGLAENIYERLEEGQKFGIVAGVDIAHMGEHFGDDRKITPEWLAEIEAADKEYLSLLQAGDKKGLFEHVVKDNNARRICGFPTMYVILDVLERLEIKPRSDSYQYHQSVNEDTQCIVTYGSLGMYSKKLATKPNKWDELP